MAQRDVEWLLAAGGTWSKDVALRNVGGVRGLFAGADISEGTLLLSVPAKLLLTAGIGLGRGWPSSLAEADQIALVLMVESKKLEASEWHPWIASLPREYNLPFTWDVESGDAGGTDAISGLRCATLIARVVAQREDARERFEAIRTLAHTFDATHELRKLFDDSGDDDDDAVWRLYLWALSALESRGKYLEDEELHAERWAIVPVGDGFNHVSAEDANVDATFDGATRCFVYHTTRAVPRGSQLCLCYGPHDDGTLVQSYGFVLARNPHARVLLPVSSVSEEQEERGQAGSVEGPQETTPAELASLEGLSTDDVDWLEEHGFAADEHAWQASGPSWSLLAALRLLHATPAEREGGAAFAILEGEPPSPQCERLAWAHVQRLAKGLLASLYADRAALAKELNEKLKPGPGGTSGGGNGYRGMRRLLTLQWLVSQAEVLTAALAAISLRQKELLQEGGSSSADRELQADQEHGREPPRQRQRKH